MKDWRIFICTFLFFLFIIPSYSKPRIKNKDVISQEEEDLSLREIRRLIRQTNYDEAFKLLTIYIEQNPENFDNAQRLVAIIMEAKKKYAEALDRLIVLISTDPDNDEEIYKVIKELKKIEKHPTDSTLTYIDNIDKVVTFTHNQKESNRILKQSGEFVAKQDYLKALDVAKEGFSLYREEFEDRWGVESETLETTDLVVGELNEILELLKQEDFNSRFELAVNTFIQNVNQELYAQALDSFTEMNLVLEEFCNYRKIIYSDGYQLKQLNESLIALGNDEQTEESTENNFFDTTDASYLPFMIHFIFGDSEISGSGILPALDSKYNLLLDKLNETVYAKLEVYYNKALTFLENNIQSSNASLNQGFFSDNLTNYVNLENQVIGLKEMLYTEDELSQYEQNLNRFAAYPVLGDYVVNLVKESERVFIINSQVNAKALNQETLLANFASETDNQRKSKLVSLLFDSTAEIGNLVGLKNEQELSQYEWTKVYSEKGYDQWSKLDKVYENYLNQIFNNSSRILNEGWQKIADYYINSAEQVVASVSDYNDKTKQYSEGLAERINSTTHKQLLNNIKPAFTNENLLISTQDLEIKYKYPDIARLMSIYTHQQIDSVMSELNDFEQVVLQNYNKHEQWRSDEGITSLVQNTQSFFTTQRDKLKTMQSLADEYAALSQKQIAAAQLLKNDGDYEFEDSEKSLASENFDEARNKLKNSSEKYVRALDIQSDEGYSLEIDNKIQTLSAKINRQENEKVVRDVRELKTLAKSAYIDGRFSEAERYLGQAANRWSVTNSEEDEEIVNLQAFVNTAMNTKTGREILPSDAQAEEMFQLLDLAYQYYYSGKEKLESGSKEIAQLDFENADKSIKQLQIIYPLNQEAKVLTLRIDKITNPKEFNKIFPTYIEQARMKCKSKDATTKQEGYSDLQSYYEIDPDYKGLKNIIYQAEFDVGIRKKVDNSYLTKAKSLYNEANRLYNAGRLEAANAKIAESLNLNSDDAAAIRLKDNIAIAIGGTKIELSTEARGYYNTSLKYFNENNLQKAEDYLNKVAMLDKRFMNDDQVKALKIKIDTLK